MSEHERKFGFQPVQIRAEGDGLTLSGYAAVFDSPTMIRDWLGEYEETIARGAFKRTINARKPVMQFEHGHHPLIGSMPLGRISELEEDSRGLYVEARLSDNWLIEPVRDAIADGAVTGMSFRFEVLREEWDHDADPEKRTIHEVKLHELGPVVFPAYDDTEVGVRAVQKLCEGLDDTERVEFMERITVQVDGEPVVRLDLTAPVGDQARHTEPPAAGTGSEPPDPPEHSGLTPGQRNRALRQHRL